MKSCCLAIALVISAVYFECGAAVKENYNYCGNLINQRLQSINDRQVLVPPSTPVKVKTSLTVVMVKGIEDEEQKLTMTVLVTMQWDDPRISTGDDLCDTQASKFVVEATKYLPWYPHFTVANSASTVLYEDGWRYFPSLVFANGTVRWIQEYQFETICILALVLFPFDTQWCKVALTSPHYQDEILEFEVENPELAVQLVSAAAAQAPVWKLVGQTYGPMEGTPGIVFLLQLQRRPAFYICALMIPTLVVNIMTAATFILGPIFEEKAQVAMNCLLAYILLNIVFYTYVPTSSNSQPYLVYFFTIQNFLALGCFLAVSMLFRKEHSQEEKESKKSESGDIEEEAMKSIIKSAKVINDFVLVVYIALVAACYLATFIFIILGNLQDTAKSTQLGYTAPHLAEFSPPDSTK